MALRQLIEIHPSSANLRDFYQGGKVHHWCADPYAHGAFTYYLPMQETKFFAQLQSPVNGVHFIGEHTSLIHGWVEGSLTSALRAALDITQEAQQTFDAIIMGGNLLGLSTAVALARKRPQWRIALVDRGKMMTNVRTFHQRRFRRVYRDDYLTELANLSSIMWGELEAQLNVSSGSIVNTNDGFLFFGRLNSSERTTSEDDLTSILRACDRFHLGCEYLNGAQLQSRFPLLNFPNDYHGIFDRQAGYINITQLAQALLRLIGANPNIVVREEEEFLSFRLYNNRSEIITDRGVLSTPGKVLFLPEAYVKNVSQLLNFDVNVELWELPFFHFRLLSNTSRSPTWIEFGNHRQEDLYTGFSIDPSMNDAVIEPTFIDNGSTPLLYPSQRRHRVGPWVQQRTMQWASSYVRNFVNVSNWYVWDNETYLWTSIPGGGFITDYVPETNHRMLIHIMSVGTSFIPVWTDMLSDMMVSELNPSNRYRNYLSHVSLARVMQPMVNHTVLSNTGWTMVSSGWIVFSSYLLHLMRCFRQQL